MSNGRNDDNEDPIKSVLDGLLEFDINKLVLADTSVEYIEDNRAQIRAFKIFLYHNKRQINYNYDTWFFCSNHDHKKLKI